MESITVYPKNAKQKSLLQSLLKEMKVRYEIATSNDEILLTEKDFYAKMGQSIAQSENGNTNVLTKDKQKQFLGL